jgi:hypothetical protein
VGGRLLAALAALPLLAAVAGLGLNEGLAAKLTLNARSLGAGSGPVQRCDNSFTITLTVSGGNVVAVQVGDIASACQNGLLKVALVGAAGNLLGEGSATVTGTAVTVSPTPQPPAAQVREVHVAVVGP